MSSGRGDIIYESAKTTLNDETQRRTPDYVGVYYGNDVK